MHESSVSLPEEVIERLYRQTLRESDLEPDQLSATSFATALARSVGHRFSEAEPSPQDRDRYLDRLQLSDLALACACGDGDERAWARFIEELRPVLYRVGRALTGDDMEGRTLADSLYGDLYGDGPGTQDEHNTRTLFRYYDGRSTLATWLRAILAQRYVDHYRTNRRLVPAEDTALERQTVVAAPTLAGSPDTIRHLAVIHSALRQALRTLPSRDRLRMGCYYQQNMTLATIGQLLGEHEATVSRHLARARQTIRDALTGALRVEGLTPAETRTFLTEAAERWPFDLTRDLQEMADTTFSEGV
ncbi:MAG: sigma-70 family RNA polymerase sigma factor [Acidobacteriota bacterium]|nr:sigma-70 family RNA polymerase sigma factor [Acidobacteriota bacterium]